MCSVRPEGFYSDCGLSLVSRLLRIEKTNKPRNKFFECESILWAYFGDVAHWSVVLVAFPSIMHGII